MYKMIDNDNRDNVTGYNEGEIILFPSWDGSIHTEEIVEIKDKYGTMAILKPML